MQEVFFRCCFAPIPSASGFGVGLFGDLNAFSQAIWSTRDVLLVASSPLLRCFEITHDGILMGRLNIFAYVNWYHKYQRTFMWVNICRMFYRSVMGNLAMCPMVTIAGRGWRVPKCAQRWLEVFDSKKNKWLKNRMGSFFVFVKNSRT